MGRGKAAKTVEIIQTTIEILEESDFPLTLRRIYYVLISKGVIENSAKSYSNLVSKLTDARWDEDIPIRLLDKIITAEENLCGFFPTLTLLHSH